jgi:hypothetical protein
MCIVVGVVSLFTAVGWAMWSIWIYRESETAVKPASAFVAARSLVPLPSTTAQRKRDFIKGFEELQPINQKRLNLLDALLENAGDKLMNPAEKSAKIEDHGRLPSNSGEKPQYFELKAGRIELYDTHALFRPSTGQTVRVTDDDIVCTSFASGLTPANVKAILAKLRALAATHLSAPQEQAIRSLLTAGNQKLINSASDPAPQINEVEINESHVVIRTDGAWIDLKSDGTVIGSGNGPNKGTGSRSVSSVALYSAITLSATNLAMAQGLIVLGVMTLKQKFSSRMWLLLFAIVKIILVLAGFLTFAWIWSSFAGGLGVDSTMTATLFACWAMGFVFPIVLLMILNTRSVREYYTIAPITGAE